MVDGEEVIGGQGILVGGILIGVVLVLEGDVCGIESLRVRNGSFHLSVVEDVENRFGNGMDVVKWSLNVVLCFRVPL